MRRWGSVEYRKLVMIILEQKIEKKVIEQIKDDIQKFKFEQPPTPRCAQPPVQNYQPQVQNYQAPTQNYQAPTQNYLPPVQKYPQGQNRYCCNGPMSKSRPITQTFITSIKEGDDKMRFKKL